MLTIREMRAEDASARWPGSPASPPDCRGCKRLRLEADRRAARLHERPGVRFLQYGQMALDRG